MKNYAIDHATSTIVCTKKFYENAALFGSPECTECQKLRTTFPSYHITVRSINSNENKRVANKNLTFPNMVRYIVAQPDGLGKLAEFAKIRNLSGQKGRTYAAVKKWFVGNYPAYVIPGVSEKELDGAERFISLETARELLAEFANCETAEDIQDVITTHFGDAAEKFLPLEKAS